MRTIDEIFKAMIERKNAIPELATLSNASSVSIWRLLLYIVAVVANTVERLFDTHKQEVEDLIRQLVPGRAEWYAHKAKEFLLNELLPDGSDTYNTSHLTDEQIEQKRIVKYAVAYEDRTIANLTIKIAGESNGELAPISQSAETQFRAYMEEVKYAGVKINLVNLAADRFACRMNIWYDPILAPENVASDCRNAIKNYLRNLPFNGEYSGMALTDAVQKVDGVKIVDLISASSNTVRSNVMAEINSHIHPRSGYFRPATDNDINLTLQAYE